MSKEMVQVSIFDETYSLVTDESAERLAVAASLVDQYMREVSRAGVINTQKIAVLVSLQLASTLLQEQKDKHDIQEEQKTVFQRLEKYTQLLSELV